MGSFYAIQVGTPFGADFEDTMRARLIPVDGGDAIDITRDLTVVGRKEDCDVRLDHKSVSKIHCVIVKTDGLLLLRDLGSTNGTRVNGHRVRRAALLPNDQLCIAHFKYRVYLGPDREPIPIEDGKTLNIDAESLQDVLRQSRKDRDAIRREEIEIHRNQLPDVYPEGAGSESID